MLDKILDWTERSLRPWQRDAARRLFQQKDGLTNDDYEELYTLLKSAHGLSNPKGLTPEPLNKTHLPTTLQKGETVILKVLRDLKHVNCIAPDQELPIAPSEMTVIYGGNGTGKSGYARVMKHACRARDQAEKIHPNANDPTTQHCIPEATFDIEINGKPKTVQWRSDADTPDDLSKISVFDSHCARAYLTTEQEVAYLPYGLDVVENLANDVLPKISSSLETEILGISTDLQPFSHLLGETEVGHLITNLNEKTDPTKAEELGTLSEKELDRIEELGKTLGETDPLVKAEQHKLSAGRIKELVKRIETAAALVDIDAISTLRQADDNAITAGQVEREAAEALRAGETLLPGTGEAVWKTLFEAARNFSTQLAYPEIEFPNISQDAVCPLCQQPLMDAGERLKRFEEYIQNNVAKTAAEKRQTVETEKTKNERANLSIGLDEALTLELASLDENVISIASGFQTGVESRRTWMVKSLDSHSWDAMPVLSENPRQILRDLAAFQLKKARTFTRAADEKQRKTLQQECDELEARQNLSKCLKAVLSLIERMQVKKILESCKVELKTRSISDKSKEFASSAVTTTLKDALNDEFRSLGIGHIKTKLKERTIKGKMKHQLLLDLPTAYNLEEVLSEGEQRAIALGSFLAELQLANHSTGIVFDDPVSSLDHKHRKNLAKRLAFESKFRQVIVFTHEVVFLHQLCDECKKLRLSPSLCFLEKAGKYSGKVCEGLPWKHKSFGERIDSLEKAQKRFEKLPWPADPTEELASDIIHQYNYMRATIERVVQDLVLNATVQRFRDYVEIKRLEKVVGLQQSEVDEVFRLYQRCNDVVDAHDPSSAKDEPPPTPDELKQDIKDLKKLIETIRSRRNSKKV